MSKNYNDLQKINPHHLIPSVGENEFYDPKLLLDIKNIKKNQPSTDIFSPFPDTDIIYPINLEANVENSPHLEKSQKIQCSTGKQP